MAYTENLPNLTARPLAGAWHGLVRWWRALNTAEGLPHNMRAEECTIVLCFKLSLAINIYTGGATDMTFSARCHHASRTTKNLGLRLAWITATALIDVLCGMLRGEAYHCETAWKNHIAR